MSVFGNENVKYTFKYYPGRGQRLAKLDPVKGNIIGYIDNYGEYAAILRDNPKLKKKYDSTVNTDRTKMAEAVYNVITAQHGHATMMGEAMKLGILREDIEKLVAHKDILLPMSWKVKAGLIPGQEESVGMRGAGMIEDKKRKMEESGGYYMMSTNKPDYISLEERKKKSKKHKVNRKIKRCKCKK
jgi:hypothetical protein